MSLIELITCPGGATQSSAPTESTPTRDVASTRALSRRRLPARVVASRSRLTSIISLDSIGTGAASLSEPYGPAVSLGSDYVDGLAAGAATAGRRQRRQDGCHRAPGGARSCCAGRDRARVVRLAS